MADEYLKPDSGQRNLVRLYSNMLATLECGMEEGKLGELFSAIRASGQTQSLPVAEDHDVQRLFKRLGFVAGSFDNAKSVKVIEEAVRNIAEANAKTAAQISLVIRLYAAGMYGVMPKGICSGVPRCRECGITKDCDYFNAPPDKAANPKSHPAKRLAGDSPESLSDEEVLQLIIGGNRATVKDLDLAKALLVRYGSLRGIAAATYGELAGLRDVSESAAVRLTASSAFNQRVLAEKRTSGPLVRSGKDFYDLYYHSLRDLKKEIFIVVLMDQKNRVIRDERVSEGTLTASLVHPREVFAPAIRESAAAVAFVHNHPSGDSTPSLEDKQLTQRLVKTAQLVGVRVLDHVIVGEGEYTSFVDEGLM